MKSIPKLLALAAICLVSFASCKKKKDDSVKAKLSGKWKLTQSAYDANNNGVMDASEIETLSDSFNAVITFNGDGTGTTAVTFVTLTQTESFSWNLLNSDKDLHMKYTTGTSAGDEVTLHIESLAGSDLKLKEDADGSTPASWTILKKQ